MCGEHVAMAAVLPYVWSDACRDRVLFHPSCRFSMRMEHITRRRRTVRARWLFLHTHGAHPYTPLSDAWRTVLLHAHGAHREKFARPDSSTAVSPYAEPQQTQFAGLCRCFTYNCLKLFKTIFCGLKKQLTDFNRLYLIDDTA